MNPYQQNQLNNQFNNQATLNAAPLAQQGLATDRLIAQKDTLVQESYNSTSTGMPLSGEACIRLPTDIPVRTEFRTAPVIEEAVIEQAPVLKEVIEKRQENIIKQDVITEIHNKPMVEIREQAFVKQVKETPVITQTNMGTIEENFAQPQGFVNPYIGLQAKSTILAAQQTITEAPAVTKTIIEQPIHKIVNQPLIVEEHEKTFINVQQRNVVRRTTDAPIVTVTTAQAPIITQEIQQPQLCAPLHAAPVLAAPVVRETIVQEQFVQRPVAPQMEIVEEVHEVTHPRGTRPPLPANAEVLSTTYGTHGTTRRGSGKF